MPTKSELGPARVAVADVPKDFVRDLVSVIVPAYNRAHLIVATLESALAQTYTPLEIIVVDDGSSDGTPEVVQRFGAPVRYVRQSNAGVAAARNRGFAEGRGEFIALLDSDDIWLPWKLEAQVAVLRSHPDIGMVWTDMSAIDGDGNVLYDRYIREMYGAFDTVRLEDMLDREEAPWQEESRLPENVKTAGLYCGDAFPAMFEGNVVHTSTVLLRRDRLLRVKGFDTAFKPCGEDYDFHMRTTACGPVAFLDVPSIQYRIGVDDQITSKYLLYFARHDLISVKRWLELSAGRYEMPNDRVEARLARTYGWIAEEEIAAGNWRLARQSLVRTMRLQPLHRRQVALLIFTLLPPIVFRAAQSALQVIRRVLR